LDHDDGQFLPRRVVGRQNEIDPGILTVLVAREDTLDLSEPEPGEAGIGVVQIGRDTGREVNRDDLSRCRAPRVDVTGAELVS